MHRQTFVTSTSRMSFDSLRTWLWLCGLFIGLYGGSLQAAPKSELWPRWQAHDEKSERVINHGLWEKFLGRYVVAAEDGINRVAYHKVSGDDAGYLRVYLDQLQRTPVSTLRRAEQRAFWINLYNAQTVKLILERYPLESILEIGISPGWFAKGPWGAKILKIEGENVSLDDIEHRILRPIWKDARIHYAVNCASNGCPSLATEPFTASNTESLLDTGARAFINEHPAGVRVVDGELKVSSIYKWFSEDFGDNDASLRNHLLQYANDQTAALIKSSGKKVRYLDYDWALNEIR